MGSRITSLICTALHIIFRFFFINGLTILDRNILSFFFLNKITQLCLTEIERFVFNFNNTAEFSVSKKGSSCYILICCNQGRC